MATKIIGFGDNDTTNDAEAVNKAMIAEPNVNLFFFLGDGPYSESGTEWVSMMNDSFSDKKDRLMFCRGNHDEDESESKQTQRDMEAWFPEAKSLGIGDTWLISKQIGNVYVISMDTQDLDVEFKRDQFNWVTAELAKAKQLRTSGQIDWIVCACHKPFFTLKSSHSPYTAVRFLYKDLFRDAQVDFMLHGHNHNTQLWLPMIPNQSEANGEGEQLFSLASDGKTFDFTKDHGTAYIVSGHAGHEWNSISDSGAGVKNVQHYRDDGDFGFTILEFDGKKAKVISKDTAGKVHYEYNITREGDVPPPPPPPDNKPPVANAGPDKTVEQKTIVNLNGTLSTDSDGTITNYLWTQKSGPQIQLNNANTAVASFIAPDLSTPPPPPPGCPAGQCKDPTTQQCRPIAADEIIDVNGFCKKKDVPPPPPEGEVGPEGIAWFLPEVQGKTAHKVVQSRDEADDDRWSENIEGCENGFEQTMIAKSIGISGDGHFASKLGGSNHSGGGAAKERWMDLGVRANGDVQLQWEGPHPSNHDFDLPDTKLFIKNIGKELEGNWVGLKWAQNILKKGGSPADGGVRWRMWVNTDIADDGKPDNSKWRLVLDFIDGVDVQVIQPQDFIMTGTMDCEVRRSNTQNHEVFGGGSFIRPFGATTTTTAKTTALAATPVDLEFQLQVTDDKGATATDTTKVTVVEGTPPPPPPQCPPGYYFNTELQKCIPILEPPVDTPPPPPGPEPTCTCPTGYVFDKPTHSCIPIGPPPPPPPGCPAGQCKDPTTLQCRNQAADETIDANGFCVKIVPPPEKCPAGQCKDPVTKQCRPLKDNEQVDIVTGECVAIGPPPPPPVSNNYKFLYKFGSKGNGDGQFIDPHDTTFDTEDNVYIPDRERNDIQVFTHDGKFIRKFGGPGSGPGQFNVPYSCQIGPDDTIWVCDRENSRVQKLSKDGTFLQQWTEMGGKKLNMPEDLAFDNSRQFLYFTDTENNRIVKCTKDMEFVLEWGSKGDGDSQFDHPHGIDVGPDGNVYVNSGFQPYIKKFTPDGQFIKKWGSEGTGEGQFLMFLEHLDVDEHGRVFIINNNVRPYVFIFDSEGKYLGKFGSEKEGSKDGEFKEPEHVTIDKQGRAFCVDSGNFRIQVFQAEGGTPPPPPPPPVNNPPVADAGQDQTVAPNVNVTLNGSKSFDPDGTTLVVFNWKQVAGPIVNLTSINAPVTSFVSPPNITVPTIQLTFQLTVTDDRGLSDTDITEIMVQAGTPPPPPPPPPNGDVLWDSNVHLKTGQKYTITDTHGSQEPDGKGVFMAASGNPRLHVDADGTFHLEADSGHGRVYIKARNYNSRMEGELMFEDNAIRNTTLRLRSRHNMGGACENRFGGFGVTVERAEQLAETSTERCHNEHSNTVKNPLEKHIEVGQWIKFKYSCWSNADKSAINQKLEYDYNDGQGFKTVIEESFDSVEPHMMDEAKFMEESYCWLRVNNESTGKVAYRNIRIIKI